jgi:5-formyltetrahydrofolate cyclo-ligase
MLRWKGRRADSGAPEGRLRPGLSGAIVTPAIPDPHAVTGKPELRRLVRRRVQELHPVERSRADRVIGERLSEIARELGVVFVAGYIALPDEVRIDGFLAESVAEGRLVFLPKVEGEALAWARWKPSDPLRRDDTGVLYPEGGTRGVLPEGRGLVAVPGRAFDADGARLGRGRGFFDRFLASKPSHAATVGVGYECQVVGRVPVDPHDIRVDAVVTEIRRIVARRASC